MLNKKRMLSLLLSAALSLTVPVSAYAETETTIDNEAAAEVTEAVPAEDKTSETQEGIGEGAEEGIQDPVAAAKSAETDSADGNEEASETIPGNAVEADPIDREEALPGDEEEKTETDPAETEEAEGLETEVSGEEKVSLSKITFTSDQDITLSVSSAEGMIVPATEEELASYSNGVDGEDAGDSGTAVFTAVYLLAPGEYTYAAAAAGYTSIEGKTFVVAEGSSSIAINIELERYAELPYGFKGMPEGYEFSSDEIAAKQKLEENNVVAALKGLDPGEDYVEGEVIFLSDDASYVDMVAAAYSAELKSYNYEVAVLTLTTASVEEAVTAAADPDVPLPAVEPNYIQYLEPVESDSENYLYSSSSDVDSVPELQGWKQWYDSTTDHDKYLKDPTEPDYQYFHDIVNTYAAWGVTRGSGVTVAVVDSGVAKHEDMDDCTILATDESLADKKYMNHGTHVAGIIAANRNNNVGGAGIAPDAAIISARALDAKGLGTDAQIIAAINAVRLDGTAKIMNMSLGGHIYSSMEYDAIKDAIDSGITVVAAMGNDGTNIKNYPAAFDIPGLIAVGSTTEAGTRSTFSNYGEWQDVSAPGSAIMSTVLDQNVDADYKSSSYESMNGTSMATPIVAGVCALYMSAYGYTTPVEMEKIIKKATTNGVVDASKLFMSDTTAPCISVFNNTTVEYGSAIQISSNSGVSTTDNGAFVYTIDGSYPSVKNGEVQGTTNKYDTLNGIAVTAVNGFIPGKTITIRAAAVSGMGVLSKVITRKFTVGYDAAAGVEILNAPESVIAGKSVSLAFAVLPAEAMQKVTWTISSRSENCNGTTIDKNGLLQTYAADSGSVTVQAETSNGKTAAVTITVQSAEPVYKLTLSQSKWSSTYSALNERNTIALIPTATNKYGKTAEPQYAWKSSNVKVAAVDASGNVTAEGKGTATITCTALDGSKKTAKCSVTVSQLVETIEISGQERIAPGKTAIFKATVTPKTANNRKIQWTLTEAPEGVTINANGQVRVPKNVTSGTIAICAAAADGSGIKYSKTIEIAPLVTAITLQQADTFVFGGGGITTDSRTGALKTVTLWTVQTDYWDGKDNEVHNNTFQLSSSAYGPEGVGGVTVAYSSSNTKVATVNEEGLITAVAPGSAKITCKALDGSGKSASITAKVIIPASGVSVVSQLNTTMFEDNGRLIAPGKSAANKAVISSAFGKPSSTKVVWSSDVKVYSEKDDKEAYTDKENSEIEEDIKNNNMFSLSSTGTLRIKKDISKYSDGNKVDVIVIATAVDGTELSGKMTYRVSGDPLEKLGFKQFYILPSYSDAERTSGYFNKNEEVVTSATLTLTDKWRQSEIVIPIETLTPNYSTWYDCTVKSSNPKLAGGYFGYVTLRESDNKDPYYEGYALTIYTNNENKTGTVKITATATDGSNKSCSLKLVIK